MSSCSCPNLALGTTVLEHRNWNPDCAVHGLDTVWWNSPEQVELRARRRRELVALQERAREARRLAKEKEKMAAAVAEPWWHPEDLPVWGRLALMAQEVEFGEVTGWVRESDTRICAYLDSGRYVFLYKR